MPRRRIPQLSYHRGQQRWYVTLDGKEHYLHKGRMPWTKTAPPRIQAEYNRRVSAWLAARAEMPVPVQADPTLNELWLGYYSAVVEGAKYRRHGKRTREVGLIRDACKVAAQMYGDLPARDFGPMKLKTVRAEFVAKEWTRETINKATHRVKRMFRWGVEHELLPESVHRALQAVPDLTAAEHARCNHPVSDVDDRVLLITAKRARTNLGAMILAHRWIGCRAQEICVARTCDFDLAADGDDVPESERCWLFTPSESKTGERYWVGPKAQEVLRPRLDPRRPNAWLFPTRKRGRGCWNTTSYRRAVARTIAKINRRIERVNAHRKKRGKSPLPLLPHWFPLQVRHAAAEEARRKHPAGLEATQARLRHKEMNVSQRYAHDLSALGRDVARKLG